MAFYITPKAMEYLRQDNDSYGEKSVFGQGVLMVAPFLTEMDEQMQVSFLAEYKRSCELSGKGKKVDGLKLARRMLARRVFRYCIPSLGNYMISYFTGLRSPHPSFEISVCHFGKCEESFRRVGQLGKTRWVWRQVGEEEHAYQFRKKYGLRGWRLYVLMGCILPVRHADGTSDVLLQARICSA